MGHCTRGHRFHSLFSCQVACTQCLCLIIFYSSLQFDFPWPLCLLHNSWKHHLFYSMSVTPSGILPHCGPVVSPPDRPPKQPFLRSSMVSSHCIQRNFPVFSSYNLMAAFYPIKHSILLEICPSASVIPWFSSLCPLQGHPPPPATKWCSSSRLVQAT